MSDTSTLIEQLHRSFVEKDGNRFADLFAEDGVYELRFPLPGAASRFAGRESVREHLNAQSAGGASALEFSDVHFVITPGADKNVFTIEVELEGKSLVTGAKFRFPSSIGVVHLRDDKIISYRDYSNAIGGANAAGTLSGLGDYLAKLDR